MAKTSESISVLVRAMLWETVSLAMLPFLIVLELVRSAWGYIAKQLQ